MHDSQPLRLSILGIVAVALFTALFSRLWFLQVMSAPEYEAEAQSNRTRSIVVEGPRGRILDRNGQVLAHNRESVVVTVDRATLDAADDRDEVLARLVDELTAAEVDTSVDAIEEAIKNWNGDPFRPIVVADDVNPELYFTLSERASILPGVGVEKTLVRHYPNADLAAHVLGYVGEINDRELAAEADAEKAYQLGDRIGKMGVEQQYEHHLRGTPGQITFEVDSMNRIVSIRSRVEPKPGNDLWLTIDADLQRITEDSMEEEMLRARSEGDFSNDFPITAPAGAAVVVSPRTGEVHAMASYPTFDPNELVDGVTSLRYSQLGVEEVCRRDFYCPLENKAIRGNYPPGSTFKIFTGYAAATSGLRSPGATIQDPGSYTLDPCTGGRCTFYNSNNSAHGSVDLPLALTVSSNVYFFGVGEEFALRDEIYGDRPIQEVAERFGIGSRTGIPLPNEAPGVLIDPALKAQRHEDNPDVFLEGRWNVGDTVNLAIGQGDISVTPAQLANAYATMGNGGTLRHLNIALKVTDPTSGEVIQSFGPRDVRDLELDQGVRQVITDGLVGVTTRTGQHRGTGAVVFDGFPHAQYPVAGKTGTAQVTGKASSSVFAAWAPAQNPEYAVSVMIEQGGYGSGVAAPITRRILEPLANRSIHGTPLGEADLDIDIEAGGAFD
ncbi:MAG: penicillin-binding protein 2 [Acidimicrobiia bacterium]|nr:penicillin-binding protein 2 [Acidimicrobiia bacterium]